MMFVCGVEFTKGGSGLELLELTIRSEFTKWQSSIGCQDVFHERTRLCLSSGDKIYET
jgi:hypothetical protein